jgi:hypothetical protein
MPRHRRLKIEGGAFFVALALADLGSDLSVRALINAAPCTIRLAVEIGVVYGLFSDHPYPADVMEKSHDR